MAMEAAAGWGVTVELSTAATEVALVVIEEDVAERACLGGEKRDTMRLRDCQPRRVECWTRALRVIASEH